MEDQPDIKAERTEAESNLAEAMRIMNSAIRRVNNLGLTVEAAIVTLHRAGVRVPQVDFRTFEREPKSQ